WLTTLVDTFAEEPGAGIIGSKLVFPDGRLQEAGGIIWRDASGWNYGKFDDPKNRSTIISGRSITVRQRRSWSQDRFSRRSGDLTKGMRLLITRTPIWRLRFARPATGCYTNH